MTYKITIIENKQVKKLVGKNWDVIGTKEVERDHIFSSRSKDEPRTRIEEVHGYTPEIEKFVDVETKVLEQTVEELDLANVIKAINKL